MGEKFTIDGVLDGSADLSLFASDWWRDDDARLLLGEEGRRTVYQIEVRDGCQYFGYTRGEGFGWLIDTGVVSEVVTSSARGQSELGIWSERQESNLPLGYGIRSSHNYFTSFLPRNQTDSVRFSECAFYGSINKDEHTFVLRLTQKW